MIEADGLTLPLVLVRIKIMLLEEKHAELALVLFAELLATAHLFAKNGAATSKRRSILAAMRVALTIVVLDLLNDLSIAAG